MGWQRGGWEEILRRIKILGIGMGSGYVNTLADENI
jgi:hypothetical protein